MYLKLVSLCMFMLLASTAQAMTSEKFSILVRDYKALTAKEEAERLVREEAERRLIAVQERLERQRAEQAAKIAREMQGQPELSESEAVSKLMKQLAEKEDLRIFIDNRGHATFMLGYQEFNPAKPAFATDILGISNDILTKAGIELAEKREVKTDKQRSDAISWLVNAYLSGNAEVKARVKLLAGPTIRAIENKNDPLDAAIPEDLKR